MFVRKKKESFLTLNRRAVDDINRVILFLVSLNTFTTTQFNLSINILQEKEITPSIDNGI